MIEVLVSTMNQKDLSIIDKMNLRGKAIIINQCDSHAYIESKSDPRIRMYSFAERGVGISRNNALMRSTADICIMADDDVTYVDNYEEIVSRAFRENPEADMIFFNVPSTNKSRDNIKIVKNQRIRFYNCLKYGTFNIAFRREKILKANSYFSLLFGGGAKYGSGEDSLFIIDCLKKGLKIFSNTAKIAEVSHAESTWFHSYNEKYFFDRGALYAAISKRYAFILIMQFALMKYSLYKEDADFRTAVAMMFRGRNEFLRD